MKGLGSRSDANTIRVVMHPVNSEFPRVKDSDYLMPHSPCSRWVRDTDTPRLPGLRFGCVRRNYIIRHEDQLAGQLK